MEKKTINPMFTIYILLPLTYKQLNNSKNLSQLLLKSTKKVQ